MGLLSVGKPFSWSDARDHRKYVRDHGVVQFLKTYERVKDITNDELLWGDEVEYGIFKVDPKFKTVKLSLRGAEILKELDEKEKSTLHRLEGCTWHPEYGSWMVEATPRQPFSGYAADLVRVERNMRLRRKRVLSVLRPGEVAPTMTCFPLMGVGDYIAAPHNAAAGYHVRGPVANSAYVPDVIINPHPRFGALTRNIRARRGANVSIRPPLFRDQNTPEFLGEMANLPLPPGATSHASAANDHSTHVGNGHLGVDGRGRLESLSETETMDDLSSRPEYEHSAEAPHVHMDAMAFGMGCCCLQVTFQARDVDESRFMYDQLAVLSPVMLALTAATPVLKGRLVDTEVRWDTIASAVDDRRPAELGLLDHTTDAKEHAKDPSLVGEGVTRIFKSRYDSISTYLHYCKRRAENPMHILKTYNDIPCVVDEGAETFLVENGVDPALAYHVAHLFARDPLVIFDGAVQEVNDETATEHFENIQSTNWQTVRWKPPPPREHENSPRIGWRTEFRSMEVQPTDAENAAFTVFVVLVTRVILAFDLNLYIPLSKVDENMRRAHARDAVRTKKFWWRMHMAPPETQGGGHVQESEAQSTNDGGDQANPCDRESHLRVHEVDQDHKACDDHTEGHEEMTIEEIMLGKGDYYPGLIPLVYAYLGHIGCDADTMDTVDQYMTLITKRATGKLKTAATWIRDFVAQHPDYKHDSVVSDSIAHDLVMEIKAVGEGEKHAPSLLGDLHIRPVKAKQAYDVPLSSVKVSSKCLDFLVKKYSMRNRWTERDGELHTADATEASSSARTVPVTTCTHSEGLGCAPIMGEASGSSWWSDARVAADARDSQELDLHNGRRAHRESSSSYY